MQQVLSSSWDGRPFGHNRHGPKIGSVPFWGRGAGSPCNTMWPGPRSTFVPSCILIHPAVWPQQIWAENWGCASLSGSGAGSHLTQCGLCRDLPPCQVAFWSIQPFGHNRNGPKIGRLCSLFGEVERGPHLTQCCLGRVLPSYQVASWSIQPFGHNKYGPKIGGCAPLGEGSWVPI